MLNLVWFFLWSSNGADRFKGAYCTVLEKVPCTDIFGDMDVIADSLVEMVDKIIAASS